MAVARTASRFRDDDERLYPLGLSALRRPQSRVCAQSRSARALFRWALSTSGHVAHVEFLSSRRSREAPIDPMEFFAARRLHGLYGVAAGLKRRSAGPQVGGRLVRCDTKARH